MRDQRHRCPGLRNFSVLNVLWNGIQKLWTTVPGEVRPDMELQGEVFSRNAGGQSRGRLRARLTDHTLPLPTGYEAQRHLRRASK